MKRHFRYWFAWIGIWCLCATSAQAESTKQHDCPYLFISWNLQDFGRSKSAEEIERMAEIIAAADVVALQEVVAGKGFGAQAVARLAEALSSTGSAWDYVISDPTRPKSSSVERYTFLVKPVVTFSRRSARLESSLEHQIEREPYTFIVQLPDSDPIKFISFHAVPSGRGPEDEIIALAKLSEVQDLARVIIAGDFNVSPVITDDAFVPLGYVGHVVDETTLKKTPDGQGVYLHRQYDNIYTKGVTVGASGAIDFVNQFYSPVTTSSLAAARSISDHLPVYIWFK